MPSSMIISSGKANLESESTFKLHATILIRVETPTDFVRSFIHCQNLRRSELRLIVALPNSEAGRSVNFVPWASPTGCKPLG